MNRASPTHSRAGWRAWLHARRFALAAALIGLVAAWPAIGEPGLVNTRGGGDSPFLLQRLHQLVAALVDGHFPARWMPDANYGYGYPFYNFYAPLSLYIGAMFRGLGFSYVRAIHLAQLSGFVVAGVAAYALGRRWLGGPWAGLLASAAYTLAPFHLVNVYVRGDSLAEFWAMAFYPLILLAVEAAVTTPGPRTTAALALAYAGLILSHQISAMIFSPFILLALAARDGRRRGWAAPRRWPRLAIPLLLAFALSAWFFVPALAEQGLAQLKPVTAGYFHYSNHFRGAELVQPSLLFDYDVVDGRAFRAGLVQAALGGLGLLALLARRERDGAMRLLVAALVLVPTFMITPWSRPLWDALPLLPFTQFPWRFLSVQALGLALAAGGVVGRGGAATVAGRLVVAGGIGLLFVAALGGLRVDHLPLTDADVTAGRLAEYEWFTGNIGTTVSAEYLPPTVTQRPFSSGWLTTGARDAAEALEGPLVFVRLAERRATWQRWEATAGVEPVRLLLPTMYWPGWNATLDGVTIRLEAAPETGLMVVTVPPGPHTIVLRLGRTPVRAAAEGVSLAALLVTLWLLRPWRIRAWARWALIGLAGLIAFGALARLGPAPALPPSDLTWDFDQLGYLHHSGPVIFADGARLAGYEYSAEVVRPGHSLAVTLDWADAGTAPATLTLVSPAVNRYTPAPVVAAVEAPGAAGRQTLTLTMPADAPPGRYLPRLTRAGAPALTDTGRRRGDLFLRPILQPDSGPGRDLRADPLLGLRPGAIAVRPDGALEVGLQWLLPRPWARAYRLSLRLVDADGVVVACAGGPCVVDAPLGYGFLPGLGLPAGGWVNDRYALPLPDAAPQPLALTATLYDGDGSLLARKLGEVVSGADGLAFWPVRPAFDLPADLTAATAVFHDTTETPDLGAVVRLHGYEMVRTASTVRLTLWWEGLGSARREYTHFVHLVDPATGAVVAQHDAMPQNSTYPTGQWATGEIVADRLTIDLAEAPPGTYEVVVGLYRALGNGRFPRLAAFDGDGVPVADDALRLPLTVTAP